MKKYQHVCGRWGIWDVSGGGTYSIGESFRNFSARNRRKFVHQVKDYNSIIDRLIIWCHLYATKIRNLISTKPWVELYFLFRTVSHYNLYRL